MVYIKEYSHTHCPVDDAVGNAEAMVKLKDEYDLKIGL